MLGRWIIYNSCDVIFLFLYIKNFSLVGDGGYNIYLGRIESGMFRDCYIEMMTRVPFLILRFSSVCCVLRASYAL